ncbi:hypothetical protein ACH424_29875 [Streptomyces jumonjinensis]|uniref:hypothetical protein n=1 Tax=Streptomyces jumonjinensis TaxID=1945 RepID=UPI0037B3036D
MIYCGIDWAEKTQDVALVNDSGQLLTKRHITDHATGYKILLDLLAEYSGTEEDPIPAARAPANVRWRTIAGDPRITKPGTRRTIAFSTATSCPLPKKERLQPNLHHCPTSSNPYAPA